MSVFLLILACGQTEPGPTEPATPPPAVVPALPAGHPPVGGTQAPSGPEVGHAGTAVEVVEGGGYTYVRIDQGGSEAWVAGPASEVTVGDAVFTPPGTAMHDFASPTLGRTFAVIDFVPAIHTGVPGQAAPPTTSPHGPPPAPTAEPVARVEGGHTVAEVFAQREALAGQSVAVRGRVVKSTPGVMDRTFLHIQDGSGAAADGTHDLTVTTQGMARVGEVVTVRGTLETDRDFGMGYRYPALVADATLSRD